MARSDRTIKKQIDEWVLANILASISRRNEFSVRGSITGVVSASLNSHLEERLRPRTIREMRIDTAKAIDLAIEELVRLKGNLRL